MDYRLFISYIKLADSYKNSYPKMYFFLKDCGFQRLYSSNGNRFPNGESQNMCNSFNIEMKNANWNRNNGMLKDEYHRFLEEFFKKMDFNVIDLETCERLKLLTENMGKFGPFDDLTSKRIVYFNKKIEKLKSAQPKVNSQSYGGHMPMNTIPQNSDPKPKTQVNMIPKDTTGNMDLPDAGKEDKEAKKQAQAAEDARLNEIMRQMKLNSPVYITNFEPGKYYNPYINQNYIPNGVRKDIPLPMSKKDPNYPKFKAIIEEELILANQELDYHKIDMARNHLERAAYYLKNVIE
jgi:hypothetical protein